MERAGALIERLVEQYENKASAEQLKITAQLLLFELQEEENKHTDEYSNVSVFFPSSTYFNTDITTIAEAQIKKETVIKPEIKKEDVKAEKVEPPVQPKPQPQPKKEEEKQQEFEFDPMIEIPTLALKQQEVNETVAANGESLNDKLKYSHKEVAHSLKDSPIKDLRKGIGINDRYVFINELFRGDETMYERSIKTINGFNIFGEAEIWIKRELKLKLGWNDKTEAVTIFDQLVRRRFS